MSGRRRHFTLLELAIAVTIFMMVAVALVIVVIVVVMTMPVLVFFFESFHLGTQAVFPHGLTDLRAVQLTPGRGNQTCLRVHSLEKLHRFKKLFLTDRVGTAQNNQVRRAHLIIKELTEVAQIRLAFLGVHNRNRRIKMNSFSPCRSFHSTHNV